MAKKIILDRPAENRVEVGYFEEDGTFHTQLHEDCDPYIQLARDIAEGPIDKDFKHAAVIPHFVLERSMIEKWDSNDWKKWANNPENKCFRTWPGKF